MPCELIEKVSFCLVLNISDNQCLNVTLNLVPHYPHILYIPLDLIPLERILQYYKYHWSLLSLDVVIHPPRSERAQPDRLTMHIRQLLYVQSTLSRCD